MIFHNKKVIFIHIAKAAGTSAENWLGRDWTESTIHNVNYDTFFGYSYEEEIWLQHATAEVIKRLKPKEFDNYFKWAIVRCPYERMKSIYKYALRLKFINVDFEKFILNLPMYIDKSEEHISEWFDGKLKRPAYGKVSKGSHFTSQYDHTHIDGELVCSITKIEDLPNGLPYLSVDIFPHDNRSNNSNLEYNSKMRDMVVKIYENDFKAFGYNI
jgi:hypothetical protein